MACWKPLASDAVIAGQFTAVASRRVSARVVVRAKYRQSKELSVNAFHGMGIF